MFRVKYPNTAAQDIKLNLFPFRIIFKLLLEKGSIDKVDFLGKIPYIRNKEDLDKYLNGTFEEKQNYGKWNEWIFPYLEKFDIVKIHDKKISISESQFGFIQDYFKDMDYSKCFFNDSQQFMAIKEYTNKKHVRNLKIIKDVLQKNNYECFFNKEHKTFRSNNCDNYLEGHHVIPMSRQYSFEDKNLDVEKNILPLCPNCHRAIHFAINKHKEQMLNKIIQNTKISSNFGITLEQLKEIYFV